MALIGTIRKNFWFVLILLGLALVAFIFMDMDSAGKLGGGNNLNMGSIDGEKIDYREFQTTESVLYGNSAGDVFQKRDNLWDYMVEKTIIKKEANDLGLYVSPDELSELEFGSNPSPIIQRNFMNPQTGQFDRATVQSYKTSIDNGDAEDGLIRFWGEQRKQIIKSSLQDKLSTIVSKSLYTPTWMVEESYKDQEGKVNFSYVKIPYDNVENSAVTVTDQDYSSFLAANAMDYTNDSETRILQFVALDVVASSEDSLKWKSDVEALVPDFRRATNDSLFAVSNRGFYSDYYFSKSELPETTQLYVDDMSTGDVVGPYEESNTYRIVKLLGKQVVPDSVKARHILRSGIKGDPSMVAARVFADSLMGVLRRGTESFDSLAIKHTQDPSSKAQGGDLGYILQGRTVPEFNEYCFFTGKVGEYKMVESQFGIHIIQVNDRKYNDRSNKYKVAHVSLPIIPTSETQERVYEQAADMIANYPYLNDLIEAVNAEGKYTTSTVQNIAQNDHTISELGGGNTSRDIVKFLFENKVNTVSPNVHVYSDPVNFYDNKYVIAGLAGSNPAGLISVETAKASIATLVMNQKKGEYLQSQIKVGKNLNPIANQYNSTVETVSNAALNSQFVAGLGNEPEVLAAAASLGENEVSQPIIGNAGTYVIKVNSKTNPGAPSNIPQLRKLQSATMRNQVSAQLMQSLKKGAKIEDDRATFF